jgi:hypothetical protein
MNITFKAPIKDDSRGVSINENELCQIIHVNVRTEKVIVSPIDRPGITISMSMQVYNAFVNEPKTNTHHFTYGIDGLVETSTGGVLNYDNHTTK